MSYLQSKDAPLYVYLSWKMRNGKRLLNNDQIRQAAYLAVAHDLRFLRCRVLSIGGTDSQIHLILTFPASLPISVIVSSAKKAAENAIARWLMVCEGHSIDPKKLWEQKYATHTLSISNAAMAEDYLRQQIASEEAMFK